MLENVHYVKRDSHLFLQYGEVVCSNFLVVKGLSKNTASSAVD